MKIFLAYLHDRWLIILLLAAFCAIFSMVLWAAYIPLFAVLYAVAICLFLLLAVGTIDFVRYCRRHSQLLIAEHNINGSGVLLPDPHTLLEKDYTRIVRAASDERKRVQTAVQTEKSELTEYYTMWAHQIKTPIAAMDLLLQSGEELNPAELKNELFRIEQYVGMAMNFARMGSGDLVLGEYRVAELVRAAVRRYAAQFVRRRLVVEVDMPEDMIVLSDSKWLGFILEQLLSNSVKYTPSGKVSIFTEGNNLIVSDTGIGIKAEDLPRVFEKGFTGYNGRSDRKSTGLGLYMCKRTADMLGHDISISSETGKGTQVKLSLGRRFLQAE